MTDKQNISSSFFRRLEGALSDEEVPDVKLLTCFLSVLQLLAADVGLVVVVHVVPAVDEVVRRHPARHGVLVPSQPLEQTRLDVDFKLVLDTKALENIMTGLNTSKTGTAEHMMN